MRVRCCVRLRCSALPQQQQTRFRLAPRSRSGKTHTRAAAGWGKRRLPPFSQAGTVQQTRQTPSQDARTTGRPQQPVPRSIDLLPSPRSQNGPSQKLDDSIRRFWKEKLPVPSPLPIPVATGGNTIVATNVCCSVYPPTPCPPGPHSVISVRPCTSRRHHLYCGAPDGQQQQQQQQSAACQWCSPERDKDNGGRDVPLCTVCAVYLPMGVCV